ncbi:hypothetical protein KEJ17_03095 [Candidatus Bathyarchaeota archaeon]|nr:hypothetical protein [Candidatus Bathyarchaeota archaeon]
MTTIIDKLEKLDSRIIYILILIFTILPLVYPIGLPIPISSEVKQAYEFIEKIPSGSVVLIGDEFTAPSWTELGPSYIAVLKHLIKKDIKFVKMSYFSAEAPAAFDSMIKPRIQSYLDKYNYKYGEDWVDLGYLPGGEAALAAYASNIYVVPTDRYGKPLSELPLYQKLKSFKDFALVVELDPGAHLPEYLRQFQTTFGTPHITITYGVTKSAYIPYLASGQIKGMMAAIGGGAEYEQLVGSPGVASAGMDAVSTSHLLAAALLILGNITYIMKGGGRRKVK